MWIQHFDLWAATATGLPEAADRPDATVACFGCLSTAADVTSYGKRHYLACFSLAEPFQPTFSDPEVATGGRRPKF